MGNESAVSAFVGGSFELMSPALSIPTRPRLFIGGDILPNFAPGRDVALQGDPDCIRGPEPNAPCAKDEDGTRRSPFAETAANGTGTRVEARVGTMVYGAHIGVAFPFEFAERQLRIKPSFGWINYKVSGSGLVVDAACDPATVCTDYTTNFGFVVQGFLRETRITARDSQRFNGIGPGLELEMDTGQYGQLGVSIFMGAKAYVILDDRTITFKSGETYNDQIGNDEVLGKFTVRIDKWMYRAHVGVRVQFVGL